MSITKRTLLIVVSLLLIVGVGFSFWDYKNWRHIEKDRYGYGPKEAEKWEEARLLDKLFESQKGRWRLRYPGGWTLEERIGEIKIIEPEGEVVMVIKTRPINKSLPDVADEIGMGASRDREYVKGEQGEGVTILTWDGDNYIEQKAISEKSGKLVEISVVGKKENWKDWTLTVQEMYKSLVIL